MLSKSLILDNLNTILRSRGIVLLKGICVVKAMFFVCLFVFLVFVYGYDSWTIKKAEH